MSIWDGFVIEFSSFLHTDISPLPNLANLVFEQQYGVLRSKPSFDPFRKTLNFMIFLILFDTSFGIDF
jgi:hypothetical protein